MKTITTLVFAISLLSTFGQGDTLYQSTMHGGIDRNYILYVPESYDGTEAWPLVINLHGYAITAELQMTLSAMNPVADTGNFLVVYPEGDTIVSTAPNTPPKGLGFNVSFPGDTVNFVSPRNTDDVGFINQLIDLLASNYHVDLARVFSTGWSNGGLMSHVLACELSGRIAAIAPVAGTSVKLRPCNSDRQVPVLSIHGTEDPIVPYTYPPEEDSINFLSRVPDFLNFWAGVNGCNGDTTITLLPDVVAEDTSTVELITWDSCGVEMLHYRVVDGGHNWPGGVNIFPFLGYFNQDINASSEIWNFFKRNPHPNPVGRVVEKNFIHDDSVRSYLLYIPASYDGSEEWPLVLNYHGFNNRAADQMYISQMNSIADTGNFLIAYPQGLLVNNPFLGAAATGWNVDGNLSDNDDVDFTRALIEEIRGEYAISLDRIHATGWSMGANMSYTLACELSDQIASIATVANQMANPQIDSCNLNRPMSLLYIHGTDDPFSPFQGDSVLFFSAQFTASYWASQNSCSSDSVVTELADIDMADSSTVTLTTYSGCSANTEVLFYQINGGGHSWPGGGALPDFLGPVNRDFNASSDIWNFFNRNLHPSPRFSQLVERILMQDTLEREYLLYLPAAYDSSEAWPLVMVYHGFNTPAEFQVDISVMNSVADTGHFLVAYPKGLVVFDSIFDDTGIGWKLPSTVADHSDIEFTSLIMGDIGKDYLLDSTKVYATGWSAGGEMAFHVACALPDQIAAIASVSGQMTQTSMDSCASSIRPFPILQMHGTADPILPYTGFKDYPTPITSAQFWADKNGCSRDSTVTEVPDTITEDSSNVSIISYGECEEGSEVVYYRIENGGHTWPGGPQPFGLDFLGKVNHDINASSEIWNFFNRHSLPNTSTSNEDLLNLVRKEISVYPNPFHERLQIDLDLIQGQRVQLSLMDLMGQSVSTSREFQLASGAQVLDWSPGNVDLASGMYYLRVKLGEQQSLHPVIFQVK